MPNPFIEAEVHEIAGDMQVLRALNRKYGAFWDLPMMQLKALKVDKCSTVCTKVEGGLPPPSGTVEPA